MVSDKFVGLHNHTDASIGDSVIKVPDLVKKVEEYGQSYCAITDHASTMAWYEFQKACEGTKVKPLFGNELYCKTSFDKPAGKSRFHLVLIAQNQTGLENIRKLQRLSVAHHFYYKPLTPHPLIFENTEGVFCSTACALSYINDCFLKGKDDTAYNFFYSLQDHFGKDNVAIELQFHPTWVDEKGKHPQNFLNEKLIDMYYETGAKWIINTFDSHVLTDEDRILRKKIQSINWKKDENDISDTLKSNILGTSELSFKFAHESGIEDDKLIQKCIDNTHKIAEKCYFEPKKYGPIVPEFKFHREFKKIFCKEIY